MNRWDALRMALELYIRENWIDSGEYSQDDATDLRVLGECSQDEETNLHDLVKEAEFSDRDARNLEDLICELGECFHEMLFRKISESGMTDAEVYRRANIDRRFFSKIRNNPAYHPRKRTVLALAVALRLDLDETVELLTKAEYALSPGSKGDLIVKYFIEQGVYDVQVINYALYEFEQPLLGE